MKYSININQKAIIDMGLDLDLIDLAIFDYIKDLSNYSKLVKIEIEGKTYFWVQYNHLIENMPLLGITNKKVLLRRLDKLINAGLLEKQIINGNSTYFRFGKNYDKYVFSEDEKDDEKKEECNSKVTGGVTEKGKGVLPKSNSINYNNKNNNNKNYFSDEKLNNSFLDFINNRKELKIKMTDLAIDRMVKKIEKWQEKYTNAEIISFIDESIANGRRGLFERKIDKTEKRERTEEEKKEMLKQAEEIIKMGNKETNDKDYLFF